tara:strand:+ start:20639 stop:23143 length:2505 start_codon:yes stop_codon:yes gene_type:complete
MIFKLFSPRLKHLIYWTSNFPIWLAWFIGIIGVGIWDILWGLDPHGYQGSVIEWLSYSIGPLVVVALFYKNNWKGLLDQILSRISQENKLDEHSQEIESFRDAKWENIEYWLQSDDITTVDFLTNRRHLAHRIVKCLDHPHTRSVGIVGQFGAGKTSIINWLKNDIEAINQDDAKNTASSEDHSQFLVCDFSCWGFENSESAIYEMLKRAILTLQTETDTYRIHSLPDEYIFSISGGGKWKELHAIIKLITPHKSASAQFKTLDEILTGIKKKILFIVEDLDRNNSRSFDVQEVVAFLQQLKGYNNLKFVLTGGIIATRKIDYTKLCDHIEYLTYIDKTHITDLIKKIYERCSNAELYPHTSFGELDHEFEGNPFIDAYLLNEKEYSLRHAVAILLSTPRSLRLTFYHTVNSWDELFGEIDFNNLVGVNVLRYGAPECFLFIMRRWDHLSSEIEYNKSQKQEEDSQKVKQSVLEDWQDCIKGVEWNSKAALVVMKSLLPNIEYWLEDNTPTIILGKAIQGIKQEPYWRRAINGFVDDSDIRDQVVIDDCRKWQKSPSKNTEMIENITTSPEYGNRWKHWHEGYFKEINICLACQHILDKIREIHGVNSSVESLGFRLCENRMRSGEHEERQKNSEWLIERISEAVDDSILLVNDLYYYFCIRTSQIINQDDRAKVRDHQIKMLQNTITNGEELISRLSPNSYDILFRLMNDSSSDKSEIIIDFRQWKWFGLIILDALNSHDFTVAINCLHLLKIKDPIQNKLSINKQLLNSLFDQNADNVLNVLSEMESEILLYLDLPEVEMLGFRGSTQKLLESVRNEAHKFNKRLKNEKDIE